MTGIIKMFKHIFITFSLWLILISAAQASIVQRTITIDGNFNDWDGTLNPATPVDSSPGTNIITNPGQFSFDAFETDTNPTPPTGQSSCVDKDAVYKATPSPNCALQSTGRDLEFFTYTYTSTRLYVYVQRYSSSTNATDWYFYLDASGDGRLSDGERVLGVSWTGSNGSTAITLWSYNAVDNVLGDPLTNNGTGDGYDMPGSLNTSLTYNLPTSLTGGSTSGALSGRQMEAQILWSDVCSGCSGPQNINFHISSSRNTNLPSGLEDNMVGTPGGIITYDLGVTKTSSLNALAVGGTMSYTVSVTNNSVGNANSVTLTDLLPSQFTFDSFSSTHPGDTYNSGTGLWTIGTLAGGATATATFNVTANATGTPTNTATLTNSDTDNSNNTASKQVTINPAGDLSVTKTASSTLVNSGNAFSYTVSLINAGASAVASGLTINDTLPSGVTFVSSSCTNGSYSAGVWTTSASLAGGATASCVINVTANTVASPTVVANTATLSYSDSDNANNTASINVTVNPAVDVAVTKTSSLDVLTVGDSFTYTVTVTNSNATYSAGAVSLTDLLPAEVTFDSFSSTHLGDTYDSGTGLWTIGTLAASATATATFTVTSNATGTPTNTATLTNSDTNNANNTASKQVTINPPLPMLSITKVSSSSSANPLEVITYTITVQNMGAADAANVEINDDMSPYSAIDIDADDAGPLTHPFLFNAGTSTLTLGARTYTQNNGADGYAYSLTSGASGASSGFDGSATDWRILMTGSMPAGTSFTITYNVEVK